MDDKLREFLEKNHSAVMATIKPDGQPHVARVGVGLVDGKLWSSGTRTRMRTKYLRKDNRSTLMVLDSSNRQHWLGLETTVDILEDNPADDNLALYRVLAGEPDDLQEYREAMVKEQRLIFQFNIHRSYGQF
ncbi:MAG TPA: pyridoxamine 5'-phosphate oxidase family protein [Actinomycetota bacterium]|nr:pyridoxamine 5'-phosphate oxidase family protein [Actinomycetota bacterium]